MNAKLLQGTLRRATRRLAKQVAHANEAQEEDHLSKISSHGHRPWRPCIREELYHGRDKQPLTRLDASFMVSVAMPYHKYAHDNGPDHNNDGGQYHTNKGESPP